MKQNCCVLIPAYQPPEKFLEYAAVLRAAGIRDILVVDDGSGKQCASVFDRLRQLEGCEVIGYPVNRGKGGAMKYGFAHIRSTRPQCQVVVTADCDGQHTAQDVLRVAQDAAEHPGQLVLGVRDFTKAADGTPVPLRSRLGNGCSTLVFWLLFHFWLPDTQTGLRGFSASLLEAFEQVQGSRYEYETEVLTFCMREHIPLRTLPITTVYENQNEGSHFHPLRDSARIMAVMLRDLGRFLLSSLSSAVVDVLLAWFLMDALRPLLPGENFVRIAAATVGARLVSMLVNYTLNRKLVFRRQKQSRTSFVRYLLLCAAIMLLSSGFVFLTARYLLWNEKAAKLVGDCLLFLLGYQIQRVWVFAS